MKSRFGFVIHPLTLVDVARFEPKAEGKSEKLIRKVLEWVPSLKLSEVEGVVSRTGKSLSGCLIGCPLLVEDILHKPSKEVLGKIIEAGRVAEEEGCCIVGLGAYTSVAGDAGVSVAEALSIGVTTGTSFTVGAAIQAMEKLSQIYNKPIQEATVAIVGATGAIGSCLSQIMAEKSAGLQLIARNQRKLGIMREDLLGQCASVEIGDNLDQLLPKADLVFVATSTPFAIIQPHQLRQGALVVDISMPRNVAEEVAAQRRDVVVIEGGVIQIPGNPDFHFDLGFAPGAAYACMSETMILALEEFGEDFSLGRKVEAEKVYQINALAEKHGFALAAFRSFGQILPLEALSSG